MLSIPLIIAAYAATAAAQITGTFPSVPLYSKTGILYPSGIPEQMDTEPGLARGSQSGYNRCNASTENQDSLCQTSFVNSLPDFCLWCPPDKNSTVADEEGQMVAWCTQPGHGTRLIPATALQGIQMLKTPDYIQLAGFIDQTLCNLAASDSGGEMDPHGADLRGNPMGGLMYSTNFTTDAAEYQVPDWTQFIGSGTFCLKACDPAGPNRALWCRNTLDRLGCAYNAPNNAQNGTFEFCEADDGEFPGVYTSNGVAITYSQPAESLGPITTVPYTPVLPSSSNCLTYASTDLFTALPAPTTTTGSSLSIVVSTGTDGVVRTSTSTGSVAPTNTSTSASNGASSLAISGVSILSVAFAAIFLS